MGGREGAPTLGGRRERNDADWFERRELRERFRRCDQRGDSDDGSGYGNHSALHDRHLTALRFSGGRHRGITAGLLAALRGRRGGL